MHRILTYWNYQYQKLKEEIPLIEYLFWWACRLLMIYVCWDAAHTDHGGHFNLQMFGNLALLFVIPELHFLLPEKKIWLARIPYRGQTIAAFMVALTSALCGSFDWYGAFYWMDTLVHFIGGIIVVPSGYYILEALFGERFSHKPLDVSISCFGLSCFMAIAWEIYEFLFDWLYGATTQDYLGTPESIFFKLKDPNPDQFPLFDTMFDICAGFLGAVVGAFLIRLWLEHKEKKAETN